MKHSINPTRAMPAMHQLPNWTCNARSADILIYDVENTSIVSSDLSVFSSNAFRNANVVILVDKTHFIFAKYRFDQFSSDARIPKRFLQAMLNECVEDSVGCDSTTSDVIVLYNDTLIRQI